MAESLVIWLYGMRVAKVESERRRLRLTYTPEAMQEYASGTPLLSLSLPVSADSFGSALVRPFLDGLLPEGEPRRAIAEELSLRADDTFALIRALGRDCAGAVIIQPEADPPPAPATTTTAQRLTNDELISLVANLRTTPLGAGDRVRISLGGAQEKLLLTRMPDGQWGRPIDGTPSTHILKPEIRGYPNTVENEAFAMRLARHLGLPVADVETILVAERPMIVVARYDRLVDHAGSVTRIHQEDFCQATGTPPRRKYQENGGPTFRDVASILSATNPGSVPTLLGYLVLHVLVGNGDAHAKNFSLLHSRSGSIQLAPLYDVMSTLHYGDDRLAMYIDQVQVTARVTRERVLNEARTWQMSRRAAEGLVGDLIARAPEAIERAQDETPNLPEGIGNIVRAQLVRLSAS